METKDLLIKSSFSLPKDSHTLSNTKVAKSMQKLLWEVYLPPALQFYSALYGQLLTGRMLGVLSQGQLIFLNKSFGLVNNIYRLLYNIYQTIFTILWEQIQSVDYVLIRTVFCFKNLENIMKQCVSYSYFTIFPNLLKLLIFNHRN